MSRFWFSILVLTTYTLPASAAINDDPDHTLLWNNFSSITIVDSFAVVTADDGVMACRYDPVTGMYKPVSYLFLNSPPYARKQSGNILAVRSTADILYFVDISDLPDLSLLGRADIDIEYHDFALEGQSLYICAGFDGLFRYKLDNYNSPQFADSSMIGIHYTRVEIQGDRMYALDDYNGILQYDISGNGFGQLLNWLYIPLQASELLIHDSEIIISTISNKILLSDITDSGLVVTDTISSTFVPAAVFAVDTFILSVASSYGAFDLFTRSDPIPLTGILRERPVDGLQGDVLTLDGSSHVVFPGISGGLVTYNLDRFQINTTPITSYARPGPVLDISCHNGQLYTGGLTNPLDVYEFDVDGRPSYDFTALNGLDKVGAISQQGDSLFVLYPQVEGIVLFTIDEDELVYDTLLATDSSLTLNIRYNRRPVGEYRSLFAIGASHLDIYIFSDTADITYLDRLTTLGGILDVEVFDSLLIFSTDMADLWVYRIYDDFSIEFRSVSSAGNSINDLVPLPPDTTPGSGSRLIGFAGDHMLAVSVSDPSQPFIEEVVLLPIRVASSALEENLLYTTGTDGIGLFNISAPIPVLIDYGGRSGSMICVENGIAATSNGNAVHLYDLRSYSTSETVANETSADEWLDMRNYPNPFNTSTSIGYYLPEAGRVELAIYNLLGQRVVTLVDDNRTSGPYVTVWEGQDSRGRPVASGIYFYRLVTDSHTKAGKMILIK